jgi:hypothetical protein
MARAAGKATTKKRIRRHRASRVKTKMVKRLRWTKDGQFTDPIIYAYDAARGEVSPVLKATWLPELVGLLIKAVHYFEIDGRLDMSDTQKGPLPSKETLRIFFLNQKLSDGSSLSSHLASTMATCCLPLRSMKGGRPRKGQPRPADDFFHPSVRVRERALLGALKQPGPRSEEKTGPSSAKPQPSPRADEQRSSRNEQADPTDAMTKAKNP